MQAADITSLSSRFEPQHNPCTYHIELEISKSTTLYINTLYQLFIRIYATFCNTNNFLSINLSTTATRIEIECASFSELKVAVLSRSAIGRPEVFTLVQ